ncbi:hypothetical protein MPH_02322 [Macrophomina phaseolina MS6]|uniref:Uncharacterized protein n=1 Tax=Macrophomina phaseolina (strain MS6) TaxID=1126212 RepID=K2RCZ2_MACPH|nr:hypothetical protein MPH_02322 [Macrophomina phaseolina MS6]
MDPDVQKVIDTTVAGTISALESAAKEASVKRFVLTSSAGAVRDIEKHIPEKPVLVDEFNEDAVALARNIPKSLTSLQKGFIAYEASKTISEQKAWAWVKENQPNFGFSTVVAPAILGRPLSVEKQGHPASSAIPVKLFEDNAAEFKYMSRFFYVSGEDVGLIHVAALVHPDVGNERIFAYAGPYSWNDWLKTFRELCPGKKFPDDAPGLDYAMSKIEGRERAERLLIDMGKPGFMGLEETVKANIEHLLA